MADIAQKRSSEGANIEWIAVLRGLAAMLVFVSHLKILPLPGNVLFILGRIGVVCFFLITGYLTISSRDKRSALQYLFNRLMRIYPIYWILLTVKYLITLHEGSYSFIEYLCNLTLFEEFIGYDAMIGESWMLPIQLCFFVVVMIGGSRLFISKNTTKKQNKKRAVLIMTICQAMALVMAVLRYLTSKPFPTAFFLLIAVSILGIYIWYYNFNFKELLPILIIFEIGLVASVIISYPNRILAYIAAYNAGLLLFLLFSRKRKEIAVIDNLFKRLGEVGYTFFLGASIPWIVFEMIYPYNGTVIDIIVGCVFKFVFTLILSIIITKFIEKPLLKLGKRVEHKIGAKKAVTDGEKL